jgi:taurine dioxygenase
MTYQHITVAKLSPKIGAEIGNVNLCEPITDAVMTEIRHAFVENQVIFFRDQPMTVEQHKVLARKFGPLFVHPASKPVDGHRELIRIHADENSTKVAGEEWHTDTSCEVAPPMGSILHMRTVPDVGGDTLFASMYAAYEALSPAMKATLEPLTAHHSGGAAYSGYYGDSAGRTYPEADHPIVCVHPESGRKLLFVNSFYTTRINGLPKGESGKLLEFLFRHVETPEFQCRFRWKPHSVAFWDNRCTQHRAIWDYFPALRSGFRIQIEGSAPQAASPEFAAA